MGRDCRHRRYCKCYDKQEKKHDKSCHQKKRKCKDKCEPDKDFGKLRLEFDSYGMVNVLGDPVVTSEHGPGSFNYEVFKLYGYGAAVMGSLPQHVRWAAFFSGRQAELTPSGSALFTDVFIRRYRYSEDQIQEQIETLVEDGCLREDTLDMVGGYMAGIRQYIAEVIKGDLPLPAEFEESVGAYFPAWEAITSDFDVNNPDDPNTVAYSIFNTNDFIANQQIAGILFSFGADGLVIQQNDNKNYLEGLLNEGFTLNKATEIATDVCGKPGVILPRWTPIDGDITDPCECKCPEVALPKDYKFRCGKPCKKPCKTKCGKLNNDYSRKEKDCKVPSPRDMIEKEGAKMGSFCAVVAGKHTNTGKPIQIGGGQQPLEDMTNINLYKGLIKNSRYVLLENNLQNYLSFGFWTTIKKGDWYMSNEIQLVDNMSRDRLLEPVLRDEEGNITNLSVRIETIKVYNGAPFEAYVYQGIEHKGNVITLIGNTEGNLLENLAVGILEKDGVEYVDLARNPKWWMKDFTNMNSNDVILNPEINDFCSFKKWLLKAPKGDANAVSSVGHDSEGNTFFFTSMQPQFVDVPNRAFGQDNTGLFPYLNDVVPDDAYVVKEQIVSYNKCDVYVSWNQLPLAGTQNIGLNGQAEFVRGIVPYNKAREIIKERKFTKEDARDLAIVAGFAGVGYSIGKYQNEPDGPFFDSKDVGRDPFGQLFKKRFLAAVERRGVDSGILTPVEAANVLSLLGNYDGLNVFYSPDGNQLVWGTDTNPQHVLAIAWLVSMMNKVIGPQIPAAFKGNPDLGGTANIRYGLFLIENQFRDPTPEKPLRPLIMSNRGQAGQRAGASNSDGIYTGLLARILRIKPVINDLFYQDWLPDIGVNPNSQVEVDDCIVEGLKTTLDLLPVLQEGATVEGIGSEFPRPLVPAWGKDTRAEVVKTNFQITKDGENPTFGRFPWSQHPSGSTLLSIGKCGLDYLDYCVPIGNSRLIVLNEQGDPVPENVHVNDQLAQTASWSLVPLQFE